MTRATRIFVRNGSEERGNALASTRGFQAAREDETRDTWRDKRRTERGGARERERERERETERGNGCVVAGVAKKERRERRRMRSEDGRESRTRTTIWVSY